MRRCALFFCCLAMCCVGGAEDSDTPSRISPPTTVEEARSRAKLLHETIRGALQVMHRDFFDDEEPDAIPSASMQDVFDELSHSYQLKAKWLVVETDVVNVDHKPSDDFERAAVKALADGQTFFEAVEAEQYRSAGAIRLGSQCLKCHLTMRKSTEARTAGLLISMPLKNAK